MKSRSPSQICALPTGGLSRCRCSSIHFLKLSGASSMASLHGGDALQLDGDGRRQAPHFHGRAAGRVLGEVLRPEPVVGGKVALHVGEEDGDVDQPIPARSRFLEDSADVLEHGTALRLDVVSGDGAVRGEAHARDLVRPLLARADSGQEEEVSHPAGVGKVADRVRRARGDDSWSHNFTQTFFGSVKKRKASRPPSRPMPDSFIPPNGVRKSRSIQQLTQTMPLWIWADTRWARERSRVQSDAASP